MLFSPLSTIVILFLDCVITFFVVLYGKSNWNWNLNKGSHSNGHYRNPWEITRPPDERFGLENDSLMSLKYSMSLFFELSISCCHFLQQDPNIGDFLGEFKLTALCWLEALGQGTSEMRSVSRVLMPTAATGGGKNKTRKYFTTFFIRRIYEAESWGKKRVSYCALKKTFSNATGKQSFF